MTFIEDLQGRKVTCRLESCKVKSPVTIRDGGILLPDLPMGTGGTKSKNVLLYHEDTSIPAVPFEFCQDLWHQKTRFPG